MAGQKEGRFKELISPFLRKQLAELEGAFGRESCQYQAIARQYIRSDKENRIVEGRQRRRHYEAEMHGEEKGLNLRGVERLYRRTVVLEPTTACPAHCRWCLRGQYEIQSLKPAEVLAALNYFASDDRLREILITGGDPLMAPPLLEFILDQTEQMVPQIEIVRIGTRMLTQAPERVNDALLNIFRKRRRFRIEFGVHICSAMEFWPETLEKLRLVLDAGIRVYNQHALLKGVNDNAEALIELYDGMRRHNIEAHYLFHCIPMKGMDHHRTTVQKGLDLISTLDSGGHFSGRSKPHYAVMTDIGKIVLYHGSVVRKDEQENFVLLRSGYRYEERMAWNPSWRKPDSCEVDESGRMNVWYPDGCDTPEA